MSPFQHTRGPWRTGAIDPSGARRVEAYEGQSAICYVAPWEALAIEGVFDPVMEANAQLILAAPDLLHAARGCLMESGGSTLRSPGTYHVKPERMQALARAVSKAGRSKPTPLEALAIVHDEANLVHALEELLESTSGTGTHGGDFRVPAELLVAVKQTFNKWKESIR